MLIESTQIAHMLSGLSVDREKAFNGLKVVLLMERDQRYDDVFINKSLTIVEKNNQLAEIQFTYTKAIKEAKEILLT